MTQNNAATTDCKTDLTEQFLFWAVQYKISNFVSIKSLLRCFPKKYGLYYEEKYYTQPKRRILISLRGTK